MLRNGHRRISWQKYSSKTTTVVDQAKLFDKISSIVQHSRTLMYIYRNRWGLMIGRRWAITNYTNLTYVFNKSVLLTKLNHEIIIKKFRGILFLDKCVRDLWNLTEYGRSCLLIYPNENRNGQFQVQVSGKRLNKTFLSSIILALFWGKNWSKHLSAFFLLPVRTRNNSSR